MPEESAFLSSSRVLMSFEKRAPPDLCYYRATMESVQRVYNDVRALLCEKDLGHYVEPVEHVFEVECLRRKYRPDGDVKLLLIAESHVRVSPDCFASKGSGFIYQHHYYTPWWHDFILPAFGKRQPTNPEKRLRWLECLKFSGFWLLDVSLLSLSGYHKVDRSWPRRPLDGLREEIIKVSWGCHVKDIFDQIMDQGCPPVVCAFESISFVLPWATKDQATIVKFKGRGNAPVFHSLDYPYGTQRFCDAARKARIEACFLESHSRN